jgi:predicted phosphodiesterase
MKKPASPSVKQPWSLTEQLNLASLVTLGKTAQEISTILSRPRASVENQITRLQLGKFRPTPPCPLPEEADPVLDVKEKVELPPVDFGRLPLSCVDGGNWLRFGLVADTHLACEEERLAELHTQYDLFEKEGIKTIFHAGNMVDGYIDRINGASVKETSIDGQCQYVVDNYPRRKGITTYYITGDDHEGWWMKEGFNFGAYLGYLCSIQDRPDLKYIGHVEADVELKTSAAQPTIIKIQHPGGGSAYSRSYTGQKQVESFEGGEKPNILVQGHYHVSNYMQERNVHVINLPGFQDQTVFARKKRLRMEVGGAILEFKVNPDDGTVTRCRVEFNRYFTRSYYKNWIRSDRKVLGGKLVLTP